jgi:hypothetical protein
MQVNRPSTPPSEPPSPGPATGVPGAYKWWVVFMLWFVCFFNYADRQAIFAVFPKLKEEFGETFYFPASMSLVSGYHDTRTRPRAAPRPG